MSRKKSFFFDRDGYVKPAPIVFTCLVGVLVLILLACSYTIIPTGYTGVRTTFGQIDSKTVQNGFNWKIPLVQ